MTHDMGIREDTIQTPHAAAILLKSVTLVDTIFLKEKKNDMRHR